jgi:hypothetical protein
MAIRSTLRAPPRRPESFSGSLPVGRPRTASNAHRIHDPVDVLAFFPDLTLDGFAGVDDAGSYHPELEPSALKGSDRALGLYRFART